ncbi:mitochondrial ornithine carbamoyltransferase [Entophlyctis helioformis]|nr:mitochondrial ornithine carbamoyltransferase [Entophlyctis helioformis]
MRHLVTLRDYTSSEIRGLVKRSLELKHVVKHGVGHPSAAAYATPPSFQNKTLAMVFSKRSTRTRVSSEVGWAYYGGHALFLGKEDIQLGAGEPVRDTARVVSSMVDLLLARVGPHSDIEEFARHSAVPVINALSDKFHPLQILADLTTLYEVFVPDALQRGGMSGGIDQAPLVPLSGLRVAWIGDANNILNSMLVSYPRLGIDVSVACPRGYNIAPDVLAHAKTNSRTGAAQQSHPAFDLGRIELFDNPRDAVKDADVIVTDTWVSMGQEGEKATRLKDFNGFQVTEKLAKQGGAKPGWKFMHCLPRKAEEVDDEVFYNEDRSIAFQEAENRKYAVMSVFEFLMSRRKRI